MTTSTSNASAAEVTGERSRAVEAAPEAQRQQQGAREVARTAAGRFIVLLLCLAVVFTALAFGTVHAWSIALFASSACLVVVLWAVDAWRSRSLRVSRNFLQAPLIGLFALGLVQLLPFGGPAPGPGLAVEPLRTLSLDPYSTRFVLVPLGALIIYFAAALSFIDSPSRLRLVTRTLIVFGFVLALVSLILYFASPDKVLGIRETRQAQGFGPFINRHHFANYMVMAAGLPLGLLFSGAVARERMPLYAFSAVLMGVALVMTNSRGGMLSLCAEIVFLVVVSGLVRREGRGAKGIEGAGRYGRGRALAVRAAGGVGLVLALLAGALLFGGDEALNRLLGSVNSADPTTGRLHFWRGAVEIIRANPWLGAGLGAFSAAYPRYDTAGGVYRLEQAHNDYLQLLSDAGVVGAALGLAFVVILFRAALKRMRSESALRRGVALGALAGCFAALVHSFFDFPLHTTSNGLLFLTLAALATVNGRVDQARRRRRRPPRHSLPGGGNGPAAALAPAEGGEGEVAAGGASAR